MRFKAFRQIVFFHMNVLAIDLILLKNGQIPGINDVVRRSAGAAERDGLENRCGGNSTQGSNPCSSANIWFWLKTRNRV